MLDRLAVALALTLSLSAAGCYSGLVPYLAPEVSIRSDRAELMQAIEDGVLAHGLRVVRRDAARGELVAVSRLQNLEGLQARERWSFVADDGQVRVELHPETRVEGSPRRWERTEFVCDCYRYAREHVMLRELRQRIRRAHRAANAARGPGGA